VVKKIFAYLILFFCFSCNRSFVISETIIATNYSGFQVECLVTTFEKNETDGVNKALRKTFERLFFIGFPNTISNTPLVANNSNTEKNNQLLKDFIDNKSYSPFVSSISHQSRKNKVDKNNHFVTNTQIVIDISSLRRHLETVGITRKFGY